MTKTSFHEAGWSRLSQKFFAMRGKAGRPIKFSKSSEASQLPKAAAGFAALTALVGVVFVRETILKLPLAQGLFSPLGLATAAASLPLAYKGLKSFKEGKVNLESFLGGSILAAVAAGEAAAAMEILWITSAGELLQTWITERSRRSIRDILKITEKETYILVGGVEVSIPTAKVKPGDTVVLHTGEKVSVDGEVIRGGAIVDESAINGRAEPAARQKGDKVFAGSMVRQGVIFVRAGQVGDKTYLARVLAMVEDSLEHKAPVEGAADRLAQKLIKAGFAATLATLIITRSLWRAFTVMLVMACPCATILSASTAVSAAMNAAARRHILIKGGRYLEEVGEVDAICFDKTGTLTTNEPWIRHMEIFGNVDEDELLQLAYSTEIHNSHPVALAIAREAKRRDVEPVSHEVCEYLLGKGVRSEIHGEEVLVGSHKLMEAYGVNPETVRQTLENLKRLGLTMVFVARGGELLGVMGFANQDRDNVEQSIAALRAQGALHMSMITGDSKYSALHMAERLGFEDCSYSVLPEEKASIVTGLRNKFGKVLMVGDGINDALALAEADIGIAMGAGGSEVAIEAADIALVKDDLQDVVYLRALSRRTMTIIQQNFWIATGSNAAGVVMGGLGLLSPVMAGMIHITHTLGILANSSRLMAFSGKGLLTNNHEKHSDDPSIA